MGQVVSENGLTSGLNVTGKGIKTQFRKIDDFKIIYYSYTFLFYLNLI